MSGDGKGRVGFEVVVLCCVKLSTELQVLWSLATTDLQSGSISTGDFFLPWEFLGGVAGSPPEATD